MAAVLNQARLSTVRSGVASGRSLQGIYATAGPALSVRFASWFKDVKEGPPDPILGVTEAFKRDTNPKKINLGVGAYRDDAGKPWVPPSVREAEKQIMAENQDKEYGPIVGSAKFSKLAAEFAFGKGASILNSGSLVSAQTLSGTGSLRVLAEFLQRFLPVEKTIYFPKPTWGNHIPIFKDTGFTTDFYTYYDPSTCGLDFDGMVKDLKAIDKPSVILLHACAHNPTGVDPTKEQWQEISDLLKEKGHYVVFDMAYQGFASGDADKDAYGLRKFVEDGHELALCQSFAKNMGLYGHRIGGLHILTGSPEEASAVMSQLKIVIRPLYSNPPMSGAKIAEKILSDNQLLEMWDKDVKTMAGRIANMRTALRARLEEGKNDRSWNHITDQIGMFCFSGLSADEVKQLADNYSIYLTSNGRISMAGVTSGNVDYLASSIDAVLSK
eukprot:Clim_evm37s108 gene=Clim_evmTU37s108